MGKEGEREKGKNWLRRWVKRDGYEEEKNDVQKKSYNMATKKKNNSKNIWKNIIKKRKKTLKKIREEKYDEEKE